VKAFVTRGQVLASVDITAKGKVVPVL